MNDDTIYRQAAIDALSFYKEMLNRVLDDMDVVGTNREKYSFGLGLIESNIKDIEELPSAERRGRWEHLGGDEWFCSACGHVITTEGSWERPWQKYCEECGASMDGVEQHG